MYVHLFILFVLNKNIIQQDLKKNIYFWDIEIYYQIQKDCTKI